MSAWDELKAVGVGMWTTFRSMFEKPVTFEYPEIKRPVRSRFKGRHVLERYENGLEKCIGCSLCSAACPADAIFVESAENTDAARYSPGERYASTYEINMLRCIFCGYCEDACPTEAIILGDNYELSYTSRVDAIYTKDMLIVPVLEGGQPTPQKTEPGKYTVSVPVMEDPVD
ncbi:MAG TPA: NADH-quinone oxidoreductase subunit NuoI [Anaerolineales bacterium]|nr:NADH-quinone oxidoreductase subunit NuoI [Anaerolineales bacterium]